MYTHKVDAEIIVTFQGVHSDRVGILIKVRTGEGGGMRLHRLHRCTPSKGYGWDFDYHGLYIGCRFQGNQATHPYEESLGVPPDLSDGLSEDISKIGRK